MVSNLTANEQDLDFPTDDYRDYFANLSSFTLRKMRHACLKQIHLEYVYNSTESCGREQAAVHSVHCFLAVHLH